MEHQKPAVGCIVHFVLKTGQHRPAIIVNIPSQSDLTLTVFLDPQDEDPNTGNWGPRPAATVQYVPEDQVS